MDRYGGTLATAVGECVVCVAIRSWTEFGWVRCQFSRVTAFGGRARVSLNSSNEESVSHMFWSRMKHEWNGEISYFHLVRNSRYRQTGGTARLLPLWK